MGSYKRTALGTVAAFTLAFAPLAQGQNVVLSAAYDPPVYDVDTFDIYGSAFYNLGGGLTLPMKGSALTITLDGAVYNDVTDTEGAYSVESGPFAAGVYTAVVVVTDNSVWGTNNLEVTILGSAVESLALSNESFVETTITNLVVGTFSATGGSGSYTFSLTPGAGDDDNGSFFLLGTQLFTVAATDFETQSAYSIRVRAQDTILLTELEQAIPITIIDNPDEDADGLPDAWEQDLVDADLSDVITNILDVLPDDDFDGDGSDNVNEWMAGTGANDTNEMFKLTTPAFRPHEVILEWASVSGRVYRVQYAPTVLFGPATSNHLETVGDGDTQSFTDTNFAEEAAFIRLSVSQP